MHLTSFILSAALFTVTSAVSLQADPAATSVSLLTLAKGTTVLVSLQTDLRSGSDKSGQAVQFTIEQNVYGPSHILLLEKGAAARGHVALSEGHRELGRSGKLVFTCDYAIADDGTHVPLNLTVTPKIGTSDSKETAGEVRAEYHSSSRSLYPYPSSDGYSDYQPDASGDGYYRPAGVGASITVDPGQLFGKGADVSADRGTEYEAKVKTDTLLSPAQSSEQLFTLKDKSQIMGVLAGFDGHTYTVVTSSGRRSIPAGDVQSIQATGSFPAIHSHTRQ